MTPTPAAAAAPPPARPASAAGRTGAAVATAATAGAILVAPTAGSSRLATPAPAGAVTTARSGRFSRTPARLRLAAMLGVLASLLVAVVGLGTGLAQSQALSAAADDTGQQVRALQVRNDLVAADATATNAFLVGGREPVEQRARYDDSLAAASGGLVAVAGADRGDAARLGAVSTGVTTYSGLVEQARANNRQGFPVGAAYLEAASQELRASALPGIDEVVTANDERVSDAFAVAGRAMLAMLALVVGIMALVAVQVWLARRTHRRLNGGLVIATVVLVVGGIVLSTSLSGGVQTANQVQDGAYARTVAVAHAYSLANDAKAMESFTLIKRGSGQAYEESYLDAVTQAEELLAGGGIDQQVVETFDAWRSTHDEIRGLDDGGDWDAAVALATSTEPDSPNAKFDAFGTAARDAVSADGTQADDALHDAARSSSRSAWIALLAGLLAVVGVAVGFSARLKEYR